VIVLASGPWLAWLHSEGISLSWVHPPWSTANPTEHVRLRGTSVGLAAVVPAAVALMPPATARPFAFSSPHTGTALIGTRSARNIAAHVVPSAIVAATFVGSYRRRQDFRCGPVSGRPGRCCHRRSTGKNADREESESCKVCLHKRTLFRFRRLHLGIRYVGGALA
jgi:hypothetical protein